MMEMSISPETTLMLELSIKREKILFKSFTLSKKEENKKGRKSKNERKHCSSTLSMDPFVYTGHKIIVEDCYFSLNHNHKWQEDQIQLIRISSAILDVFDIE